MIALVGLLASLSWGGADFLGGLKAKRLPALAVVGFTQLFGLIFAAALVLATGSLGGSLAYLPWSVLGAIAGVSGLTLLYGALATGTMGVVAPIAASSAFVPMTVGLVTGIPPSTIEFVGLGLALVGLILSVGPQLRNDSPVDRRSLVMAGGAALMFGFAVTAVQQGAVTNTIMTASAMRLTAVLIFSVILIFARSFGGVTARDFPVLVVIGCGDFAGNIFLGIATSGGEVAAAAVTSSLFPVVTVLLAWRFLHERLRFIQYLGIALVVVGVTGIAVG